MSEDTTEMEEILREAAEDGIRFAVRADANRFDALGRMIEFLGKRRIDSVTRGEIIEAFEWQMERLDIADELENE